MVQLRMEFPHACTLLSKVRPVESKEEKVVKAKEKVKEAKEEKKPEGSLLAVLSWLLLTAVLWLLCPQAAPACPACPHLKCLTSWKLVPHCINLK
eukprot:3732363-Amphidinium_carterae.1